MIGFYALASSALGPSPGIVIRNNQHEIESKLVSYEIRYCFAQSLGVLACSSSTLLLIYCSVF